MTGTLAVGTRLDAYLAGLDAALTDAGAVVAAIAEATIDIAEVIGRGSLGGDLGATGEHNSDGDVQKALDVIAHERVTAALRGAPVAEVASEEAEAVMVLNPGAPLAVAVDPLDGSSNIGVNMAVGTIFGIRPVVSDPANPIASFTTPGSAQVAAGFVTFGPATTLVVTFGQGTQIFTLDRAERAFRLTHPALSVPVLHQGVRHQRLEFPPLGRAGEGLHRGLPAGRRRPARQGLQHALARLPGGGCPEGAHARRRLFIPRR